MGDRYEVFTVEVVVKFLRTACIELSKVGLKESTCFRVEVSITNNVETIKNKVKIPMGYQSLLYGFKVFSKKLPI
jgi:hypothetical protein